MALCHRSVGPPSGAGTWTASTGVDVGCRSLTESGVAVGLEVGVATGTVFGVGGETGVGFGGASVAGAGDDVGLSVGSV